MSKIDDGGPAHPFIGWKSPDGMYAAVSQKGMSLRDWFAGQALAGMMATRSGSFPTFHPEDDAAFVFRIADAMIAARKAGDA